MVAELAARRVELEPLRVGTRARALPSAGLALVALGALGAAEGGYFPATWGWSSLAFAWIAGLALVVRPAARLGGREALFLSGLAGFAVWVIASALWAETATLPVREAERTAVSVLAALGALLVTRSRFYRGLVAGTWAATALVSLYALATRLLPDRFGEFDSLDDFRLSAPIGYWNALGILAAVGAVLAVGLAARARSLLVAAVAAASSVVLLPTLYLTFSRGSWIALAVALTVLVALDPRRLHLLTTLIVLAPAPALAVLLASNSDALIVRGSTFEDATREGHRLAAMLVLLAAVAALVAVALRLLEQRLWIPRRARLAYGAALALVAIGVVGAVFATYGGPVTLAEKGYDSFVSPLPPTSGDNPRTRLTTLASPARKHHWQVALDLSREQPLLGGGAGSYERYWLQHRPNPGVVRDAHSLYLETLAELGPVGLALLVGTLAVPLAVAVRARRHALVPAAAGAYVAYLVHAGVDWDWEMPAVTVAALFCACAILAAGRRDGKTFELGTRGRAGLLAATIALAAFSVVGLVGNQALAASKDAHESGQLARAESEARTAIRWAPWSAAGWERLAAVRLARDDRNGARAALLEAVEKDPGDWALWYDLGVASEGRERLRAYREAARLNPLSKNVSVLRTLRVLPPLPKEKTP